MSRRFLALGLCLFVMVAFFGRSAGGGEKDKITIKLVMLKSLDKKGPGLFYKVVDGKADAAEKKKLVEYFEAMASLAPPKGGDASWKMKTKALLDAARKDDTQALKRAADCNSCHLEHRIRKN
jgi:hypothetical protein